MLGGEADSLVHVQAVDMLEQAGGVVDKEPLRQAVLQLEEQVRAGRPQAQPRSEHFERFKFWLVSLWPTPRL